MLKSAVRTSLLLAAIPFLVIAADPHHPATSTAMGALDKANAATTAADTKATQVQGKVAEIQKLIAGLKSGDLTAAADADPATKAAVAERKSSLVALMQGMAPANAAPSEATTGQFVTDLQSALKPTLDSLPTDVSSLGGGASAGSTSAASLMNQAAAALADPKASMAKFENVQGLFTQVKTLMANPSMAPADLASNMNSVTNYLTELNVAPESVTKVVGSLQSMIGESAALLPK